MQSAVAIKNAVLATLASIGGAIANLLGGWDPSMQALVMMMAVDYITGWIVAGFFKKSPKSETGALSSKAGYRGLCKKVSILLMVLIAAQIDDLVGGTFSRTAVILFFAANEGLSILENLGLMGVEYPAFIKNALEALKKKGETQ